jgi:hypothetical protein
MTVIFLIKDDLQTPYRKTSQNDALFYGWSLPDDQSVQDDSQPLITPSGYSFADEDISLMAGLDVDMREAHIQRALHVLQYADEFFDVYIWAGPLFYAADPFAKTVQDLDGDAHEIVGPVTIWSGPDACAADQPYFGINVRRLVRTIDVDASRVDKTEWHHLITDWPNKRPYFYSLKALTPESRVVFRSALDAGLHLWRDRDTRQVFCTDTFREKAMAAGTRGVKFEACTMIDDYAKLS